MEKGRNKRSLALWFTIAILVSQNIVSPVMSQGFEDEKNFFPAPDPGFGSTPPSFGFPSPFPSGGGSTPSISFPSPLPSGGGTPPSSHGSGSSPHGSHGQGGSGGTGNCGNPPSHSSGGGSHTPTPSHGSGGGSHTPTPSHGSGGGSHTPTPSHGSGGGSHAPTPSHGSGGGSHTPTPSHGSGGGSYTPTPTTPSTPSYTPTPSTPTVTPTPSTPSIIPGIPSFPGLLPPPSPLFSDPHSSPSPGTCSYWRSHPDLIWSLLGWWGSVGSMFKLPSSGTSSFPGSSLTIPQALSNTRHDGIGALYREGTASLLNSMANSRFPYTTEEVRDRFVGALGSDNAASAQAQLFKLANEGRLKPRA